MPITNDPKVWSVERCNPHTGVWYALTERALPIGEALTRLREFVRGDPSAMICISTSGDTAHTSA